MILSGYAAGTALDTKLTAMAKAAMFGKSGRGG
jgi:hypothetical protein